MFNQPFGIALDVEIFVLPFLPLFTTVLSKRTFKLKSLWEKCCCFWVKQGIVDIKGRLHPSLLVIYGIASEQQLDFSPPPPPSLLSSPEVCGGDGVAVELLDRSAGILGLILVY